MTTTHRAIRRRLTLLASSSAGAIALMAAAGAATTLAPTKAMADVGCGEQYGPAPIFCVNFDLSGPAVLDIGAGTPVALSTPGLAAVAVIASPYNPDAAKVILSDGSSIVSSAGIVAFNAGLGDASVQIGSDVSMDQTFIGVFAHSWRRSEISTGSNFTLELSPTDFSFNNIGLFAESWAGSDADAPSAEVTVGENSSITSGGFWIQDSYLVSAQAPNGTASTKISVGDGADFTINGEYVAGVYSRTNAGDIDISVGSGTITVLSGAYAEWWPPHPLDASAGIYAQSSGGNITISSAADITVSSDYTLEAAIWAATDGLGNLTITSDGNLSAGWNGIEGMVADGDLTITSNGDIDSGLAINGYASGTGSVTIFSGGEVHGSVAGVAQTGAVSIHTTGDILQNGMAVYGQGFGKVTVVADGNLGSADERVYQGVEANSGTWFNPVSDDVNVTVNGDVYAASPLFDAAISANVMGDAGSAT
ncbi:MAG: hypothetical protein ACM3W4_03590, partial [Ignavibacteriales bacterium]